MGDRTKKAPTAGRDLHLRGSQAPPKRPTAKEEEVTIHQVPTLFALKIRRKGSGTGFFSFHQGRRFFIPSDTEIR